MAPKKKKKDEALRHYYLEYGVDLAKRRVFIEDDISEFGMGFIMRSIQTMCDDNSELAIEIYINSFGGCAYSGLALYDLLESISTPIHTYCLGSSMSMGLVLFLAGDIRYSFPRSTFMAHSVSSGTEGIISVQKIDIKEAERLNDILIDILGSRTKKTKAFWKKTTEHKDFYINPKEAKQLGIVTEIIE